MKQVHICGAVQYKQTHDFGVYRRRVNITKRKQGTVVFVQTNISHIALLLSLFFLYLSVENA
jgi:hypothetical protein